MPDYLRESFLFPLEPALFCRRPHRGGAHAARAGAAAAGRPRRADLPDRPRVGAAVPAAIDAKVHAARQAPASRPAAPPPVSLVTMLEGLPRDARTRFERLHARCLEMRGIAAGVRGAAGDRRQRRGHPHARARPAALAVPALLCRRPRSIASCRR
jgi:hypothetical protein